MFKYDNKYFLSYKEPVSTHQLGFNRRSEIVDLHIFGDFHAKSISDYGLKIEISCSAVLNIYNTSRSSALESLHVPTLRQSENNF